jgi:acyl-CoA synthetase (AMP-forming)/AMP-acid ligase II
VLEQLEEAFGAPVLEAYAMTEASHQMTSNPLPKHGPRKPGSVGKPTGIELAILDDNGLPLPPRQVGEVCIRGLNVTKGYKNNADANHAAFLFGWFHTGDRGYLDEEGYLSLTGRIKELINRGGLWFIATLHLFFSQKEIDQIEMLCYFPDPGFSFHRRKDLPP